jgi:hypothetical protein
MEPNPLREIRDIRRQISKEYGDDPDKVFAYYMKHQDKMKASGKYKHFPQYHDSKPGG